MQKRLTVEDIRADIQTEIDFPRDMNLWDYDLMFDFINASDFDALPEISDIIEGNQVMTPDEKERLIEIADSRVEKALAEMR
jgi:hypothetical protein